MQNKKIIITIIILSLQIHLIANNRANLDKGTFFYGNNITSEQGKSESFINQDDGETVKVTIDFANFEAKVGYFILDNFEIGCEMSFSYAKINQKNTAPVEAYSSFYGIQAYYFYDLYINLYPYLGFSYGHYEESYQNIKMTGPGIKGNIGINIFLNKTTAIDLGYYYLNVESNEDENSDINGKFNTFKSRIGINLFLY